jgi:hypothetical protein
MKIPALAAIVAALVLPLLPGCGRGPTIDASSDQAFKASVQEVSAALEPETRKEFESSMQALLFAGFEGMNLLELKPRLPRAMLGREGFRRRGPGEGRPSRSFGVRSGRRKPDPECNLSR